ncbi:unnamed protein product, partial [Heterotrigona itama]
EGRVVEGDEKWLSPSWMTIRSNAEGIPVNVLEDFVDSFGFDPEVEP